VLFRQTLATETTTDCSFALALLSVRLGSV